MSSNGHLIQLKSLDQVPLYPIIKTSNVINDAHFIGVSDSGELGQVLTKTASGAKWMSPPAAPSSASDATSAFYLQMTQDNVDYGTFIFPSVNIPVAIETPSGHYYIIQKSSVYMGETNATLDLAPYLAYQGVSTFTGTWKLYVVTGFRSDISTLLRDLSDSIASIKSSLQNDYYNKGQIDQLLEEFSDSVDLSNYYTKGEVDTIASGLSDSIAAVKGLFNSYYTKSQVDAFVDALSDSLSAVKNSFSDYYTKTQINILAQSISDSIQAIKSSFNDYYTKGQVDAFVSALSDSIAAVNGKFDSYYDKVAVDAIKGALSDSIASIKSSLEGDYYNKAQVDTITAGLSDSISSIRALFSSYYNKTQVDGFIEDISDSLQNIRATHYTKTQVDALIGNVQSLQGVSVSFNSVTDNKVTFTGLTTLPVIVVTDKGSAYPIQKGSLIVDSSVPSFTLDVTPYLAYDNSQSFSGTWTLYLTAGNIKELFGDLILQLDSAHFTPQDSRVYERILARSDSFTFDMSAFTGSKQIAFQLHLIQPQTAVTFTLPGSLIWADGFGDFNSSNSVPPMGDANTMYCIAIRWDGSNLLANLAYKKGQIDTTAEGQIIQPSSVSFIPRNQRIYTYTLEQSDSFYFDISRYSRDEQVTFELHLIQPSTAVSFTLPNTLIWADSFSEFASANPAPTMSTGDTLYCIVIRWDGSDLLANLAYTKAIEVNA